MIQYEDDYYEGYERYNEFEGMFDDESDRESDTWFTELGTYEGQTNSDGERHGFGRAVLPNGDVYTGYYKKGFRHGLGKYEFKNGAKYCGCYRKGLKNGKGVMCYPDKSRYDGCWSNNKKNGNGNFKYENGDTFSGTWKSDMKYGVGTYTFCKTRAILNGRWSNDRRTGNFQIVFPPSTGMGFAYYGTWDDDESVTGEGYFVFQHLRYMQRGVHMKNWHYGTEMSDTGQCDAKSTWVPYQILPLLTGMLPRLSKRRPMLFDGKKSCKPCAPDVPMSPVEVIRSTSGRVETYEFDDNLWAEPDEVFENCARVDDDEPDGETEGYLESTGSSLVSVLG